MATRGIQYGVRVDASVQGGETVEQLTDRLDDMAKVLEGDLKQEAEAVSAKLRELGQQQQAISTVDKLKTATRDAGQALKVAEKEAAEFAAQIAKAGPPTAAEAANLQRLDQAADAARTALQGQRTALAGAVTELQRHGVAAGQTQAASQRLNSELAELRTRAAAIGPAWRQTATAAAAAEVAMQRTHRAVGEGVSSISKQLQSVQNAYLALQGGGVLTGMVRDVAQTADAYQALAGRIRLAVGEGAAFESAMAGIQQVAIATRSDLEATATLFTKVLEAGKAQGMSQQQALALTQTINQAIQITGGSADAAKAAITQLTQGLQGGVLRGDEFNSVMEQAPRLAQAMADGLGVTRGELRAMAEQGQLSSETVIRALRLQSEAVQSEFSKLPATIGGAMQNLSTAWTVYIGEADKASGASRAAAEAINFLSQNLGTIANLLLDAGQAAAGFTALRLAQHFLGIGTAATTAATGVVATNTALAATATNGAAAAAGVSRLAGLMATLKTFTLIGLVTNFQDLGKWIGESTAKLALKVQGLKSYEELAQEATNRQKALNDAMQREAEWAQRNLDLAVDRAHAMYGLEKAGKQLVAQFDDLIKKGDSVNEAIGKIGKDFDLSTLPGIKNASAVLDRLLADGKLTSEQFRAAWAKALDGRDLAQFEVMARAALAETGRGAEQLAQALDMKLREAVRRTGLDFELISGGMSKASVSMLNDIDALTEGLEQLKAEGVDTGLVLATRLSQGIKTADSQQAIDQLRARVRDLRNELGDKIVDGLLAQAAKQSDELKRKLEDLSPGIQSTKEAMRVLGITSQESLKQTAAEAKAAYDYLKNSGTATANELKEAFEAYAKKAIAANEGVVPSAIKTEAAVRGVTLELDKTDRAGRRAGDGIVDGMNRGRKAAEQAVNAMAEAMRKVGAVTDAAGNVIRNADGTSPGGASGITNSSAGANGITRDKEGRTPEELERLKKQGGAVDMSYIFDVVGRVQGGGRFDGSELVALQAGLKAVQGNLAALQASNIRSVDSHNLMTQEYGRILAFEKAIAAARFAENQASGGARETGFNRRDAYQEAKAAKVQQETAAGPVYQTVIHLGNGQTQTIKHLGPEDQDAFTQFVHYMQEQKARSGG